MKRAAIYARVSTVDRGQDPETQLRQLREYADRRAVQALPVVEDLDILEHRRPGLRPGAEMDVVDVLLLQRGEEALHRRVVETVALAAHRLLDAVPLQDLAVGLGSVLDPSVTVMDQAGFRPAALQGH